MIVLNVFLPTLLNGNPVIAVVEDNFISAPLTTNAAPTLISGNDAIRPCRASACIAGVTSERNSFTFSRMRLAFTPRAVMSLSRAMASLSVGRIDCGTSTMAKQEI